MWLSSDKLSHIWLTWLAEHFSSQGLRGDFWGWCCRHLCQIVSLVSMGRQVTKSARMQTWGARTFHWHEWKFWPEQLACAVTEQGFIFNFSVGGEWRVMHSRHLTIKSFDLMTLLRWTLLVKINLEDLWKAYTTEIQVYWWQYGLYRCARSAFFF